MPRVTLLDYTGKGRPDEREHAAHILLYTKNTRLDMSPGGLAEIAAWSEERKLAALAEMAKTIPSSWEFVDVTFLCEGVTRACAQQITRTRSGSYAMQSQRVVSMEDAAVANPFDENPGELKKTFTQYVELALTGYTRMLRLGAEMQAARGILPMNVTCNLMAKYNLRAFVELVRSRSSLRTQGEYADIISQALSAMLTAWPWAAPFFEGPGDIAIRELEAVALELGVTPGSGHGWRIAKALDLLRKA